jgi:chaperonin GroES
VAILSTHTLTVLTASIIYAARGRGCHDVAPCRHRNPFEIEEAHQYHEVEPMKFRPLHDRVVVRRIEEDTKTAGGIIIPDTAKEKPIQGEVIAVGPGARDDAGKVIPLDLKPGDRVLFGKWSGTEVKIDGEDLVIMKESDIFGVIEGSTKVKAAA